MNEGERFAAEMAERTQRDRAVFWQGSAQRNAFGQLIAWVTTLVIAILDLVQDTTPPRFVLLAMGVAGVGVSVAAWRRTRKPL